MSPSGDERAARAALDGLPGLSWSPLGRDDVPDLAALYAACEAHDANPERRSERGLLEYWDAARSRPEEDVLLARDDGGRPAAVAWAGLSRTVTERRGVYLGGAVRPDLRGRGVGRAVLGWQLAHALAWDDATREEGYGPLVARLPAPVDQADVRDLAERHGLAVERYFFELARPLSDLPERRDPVGVRVVAWDPARSAEAHRVSDEAFRDHWGHAARTEEMWQEVTTSADFRPDWSLLALDEETDAVVGVALGCAYEQDWAAQGRRDGYTDELGVLRSHRGRGVASALLVASMHRYAASGMEAAALGVDADSPTGALGLYEGLGYRREASTCIHQLTR